MVLTGKFFGSAEVSWFSNFNVLLAQKFCYSILLPTLETPASSRRNFKEWKSWNYISYLEISLIMAVFSSWVEICSSILGRVPSLKAMFSDCLKCGKLKKSWVAVYEYDTNCSKLAENLLVIKMCENFSARESCLRSIKSNFDRFFPGPSNILNCWFYFWLPRIFHWYRISREKVSNPNSIFPAVSSLAEVSM